MKARLLMVHALSPLHAGTGQGIGVLDLPIAREKGTNYPYLPGSSLKGVLREMCGQAKGEKSEPVIRLFGPETANASDHAGALVFTDQRLLLFPVRALQGTFAWVTCPLVLERFRRDCKELGNEQSPPAVPPHPPLENAWVTSTSVLPHESSPSKKTVYLEDLDLTAQTDSSIDAWATWLGARLFPASTGAEGVARSQAWQKQLSQRFCIVPDDVFTFLVETATEINARIRLQDDTKTVAPGGLWYEENLPTESVLTGFVAFLPNQQTKMKEEEAWTVVEGLTQGALQLGGKATVGRGLCRLRLVNA